jgi:tetratricopeptide (TPR) repeat protein
VVRRSTVDHTDFFQRPLTLASTLSTVQAKKSGERLDYNALYERILGQVDQQAYLPLADVVDTAQQPTMLEIQQLIQNPTVNTPVVEAHIRETHQAGLIDKVHMLSALHVLAASPKCKDYDMAAKYAAEQEMASMAMGGPRLADNLASVDRHRGVLAFLQGHYGIALDYFSRAFERQHTSGNLANVLAALIRVGDLDEAKELLIQVRGALNPHLISSLNEMIEQDPDLSLLQTKEFT